MITVFHNTSRIDYDFFDRLPLYKDLERVAQVETDSLETAFRLTNTIDHYWWYHKEVTKLFKAEGTRSTCVGDVFLKDDKCYIVARSGFKEWEEGVAICQRLITAASFITTDYPPHPAMEVRVAKLSPEMEAQMQEFFNK